MQLQSFTPNPSCELCVDSGPTLAIGTRDGVVLCCPECGAHCVELDCLPDPFTVVDGLAVSA